MNLTDQGIVELLRSNLWRPAEIEEGAIIPRGFMVRELWHQHRHDLDAIVRFLTTYVDEKNYPSASFLINNPLFDGRNFRAGTYKHIKTRIEVNSERQQVIRQYLARLEPGAIFTFASERTALEDANTSIYKRTSEPVHAQEDQTGFLYRADNSFNEDDATYDGRAVYEWGNDHTIPWTSKRTAFKAEESVLYRNARSALSLPDFSGSGQYDATNQINQFGLYDSLLTYQYGTGEGEARHASLRSTLEDADRILYRNSNSAIDAPEAGQGYLYTADNSLSEDGTYDARLQYSKGNAEEFNFVSLRTAFRQRDEWHYRNNASLISAPELTGAGQYTAENSLNQFGLYDARLAYDRGTDEGAFTHSAMRGALEEADRSVYRNINTFVDAPESPKGSLYTADNSLGEDGTYDARVQVSRGLESKVEFRRSDNAFVGMRTAQYQNFEEVVEADLAERGTQVSADTRVNQFGLYDGQVTLQNAKLNVVQHLREVLPEEQGQEDIALYRNLDTVPEAVPNEPRRMYRQDFVANEFGLYDGQIIAKTTKLLEFGPFLVGRTSQTDTQQYQYENRDNPENLPEGIAGSSSWRRNPLDNTWDGQMNLHTDRMQVDWWGGTGEYAFSYETTINRLPYTCYVYDKYTRAESAGRNHLNKAAEVEGARKVGANDGHIMDMIPIGMGRLRARRLELLYG